MEFNITPYYDDYEETKQFYKILFRPGVAVQTREVNQLQSILQNQVTKLGDHLFKEGSMVIPGQVNYNDKLRYLKLASFNLNGSLEDLENQFISDTADWSQPGTVGTVAQVIKAIPATDMDPATLVLLYTQSKQYVDNVSSPEFLASSTLYVLNEDRTITPTQTVTVGAGDVSGRSVAAGLQAGVYYLAGHFVSVESAVLSVKKYASTVGDINAKIGIRYTESVITADDDTTLYDNAAGSPNFAAPGAHRYKITTEFVQVGLNENPENFFELIRVEQGVLQTLVNASQYNILEETLARRTYDESGNYVVDDFKFDIREARNSDRGLWTPSTSYLISDVVKSSTGAYFTCLQQGQSASAEPANFVNASIDESTVVTDGSAKWRYVKSPVSNRGVNLDGSSSNLVATFGIGKAYVQGYEINKLTNSNITLPKARETESINNQSISLSQGNYIYLDKKFTFGIPDISTGPIVNLYDRFVYKGSGSKFALGNQIGTARIGWVEPDSRGFIKVGLNNIVMNADKGFDRDVNSIVVPNTTTSTAVTSYTLTGNVKYAGNNTSSYLQIGGLLTYTTGNGVNVTFSGNLTAYLAEIQVGDQLTVGSSSYATVSSWTVVSVNSNNNITVTGSPTSNTSAGTSVFVRFAAQTVFGHATGVAVSTRFQSEYRVGDRIWLGSPTGSSTLTSMVVTRIISENRMLVSSNAGIMLASTSHGTYYANRTALFAGDVGGNYQIGINATKLTGLYQLSDYSGTTTTVPAHQAIRITGSNDAKMLTELDTNEYVDINGVKLLITKISSNSVAFAVALEQATATGTTQYPAFKINNNINQSENNSLLFKAAPSAIDAIVDNSYVVYKTTSVSGISGLSSITVGLAAASGNNQAEAAATTDPGAYFVAQDAPTTLSGPITVNSVVTGPSTITLNVNSTFSSTTAEVIYPVTRAASANNVLGGLKTKTMILGAYNDFLSTSVATRTTLTLDKSDIYRKVKIYMATSFVGTWDATVQTNAVDVTNRYQLDNGQRNYFYDVGSLKLIAGYPQATGSIRVYFDYFDHSSGDYFTKASYKMSDGTTQLPTENIPTYNGYNLSDVIDFRAKVDPATGLLSSASPPRFGTSFIADVSYYLGRKEKILLDRSGTFYNVAGVSGLVPAEPKTTTSDNAIELYDLELKPYTLTTDLPNIKKKKYDNRRYTMKDIGNIERRVANLEETTALSLLESKTQSLQIRDNKDSTLERYKTGFFVDNFSDDSNSEIGGDARFSIGANEKTLNPLVDYVTIPLAEKLNYNVSLYTSSTAASNKAGRAGEKYTITGDLLTLSYTTSTMLEQGLATTSIAVAPFVTATFLGSMRVVPDKDIYEDVHNLTKIVETVDNRSPEALAAMVAQYRARDRRPYRVETVTTNTYVDTTKTSFLIPFCRANTILMIAKGLKPNHKFYPYFDDTPIEEYFTGAMKFTFSALPLIDFEGTSPKGKTEWPRWRSLYESADVKEVVRARQVFTSRQVWLQNRGFGVGFGFAGLFGWGGRWVTETNSSWVYDYGWFRRTLSPSRFDVNLPSAANRDAYRAALGIGTSVYYYEGTTCVGSGVGVYQEGTTLYIVNGRGKLAPEFLRTVGNYNYTGKWYISVEGNDEKYLPTTTVTAAQALTSDANGYVYSNASGVAIGIFDLPDTDTVKFTTGKKPVTLTDHPDNDPDDWTSKADGTYTVEGYDVTFTKNYISTKNYVLRPYDPIAQSFKIPTQFENGCFITDVDIYFQAKPVSEPATVSLELRTCDSTGRPSGTEMVPGSEVTLRPDQVNVDATKGQIPTKFTFRQPIYLMPEKQYAFVLRTDTKNYRVWMASMGQPDVNDPTKSYTTQVLFGSLFKSQDGTLWTEDQTSDLKFKINRAVFNTADTGANVYVVNNSVQNEQLPTNPLTFVHGSNKIRVGHKNHGFSSGDTTRLYSQYWAGQYALLGVNAKLAGIPVGEIFGAYVSSGANLAYFRPDNSDVNQPRLRISDVTLDTYTITVSSVANIAGGTTGYTAITDGGEDIFGQRSVLFHSIKPTASILKAQPTSLTFQARMAKGFTYDNDANSTPAQYSTIVKDLNFNDYNTLDTSCAILTDTVEYDRLTPTSITTNGDTQPWTDSFIGTIHLQTTSDHVSPAVDMSTLSINLVQHRIDNPTYGSRLPATLPAVPGIGTSALIMVTTLIDSSTAITFDGENGILNSATDGLFSDIVPGRYITISGSSASGNNYTSTGVLVLNVNPNGRSITVSATLTTTTVPNGITIRQIEDFTEESTNFNASGESKYITNVINLQNPATQLKLQLEACVPSAADFDVYYKTGAANSNFSEINWTKYVAANQVGTTSSYTNLVKSDVRGVFTDVTFDISKYDSTGVPIDITPFTAFQIKLVMRSSNAARIPQFRNLRVIAHA